MVGNTMDKGTLGLKKVLASLKTMTSRQYLALHKRAMKTKDPFGNLPKVRKTIKLKIGVDYHGVLNHPELGNFFRKLCAMVLENNGEVHIMTGSHYKFFLEELAQEKNLIRLRYSHFFSISDHIENHYPNQITHDKNGKPIVNDFELWDGLKTKYALKNNIDMVFDDNTNYVANFITPYSLVINERNRNLLIPRPFNNRLIKSKQTRRTKEIVEP